MLDAMENASRVEIKKGFVIAEHSPEKRSKLKNILEASMNNNAIDSRIFALSWIETRMRLNTRNGDKGKACGIFQIHARYSYPMFRRKYGFRNWKESNNKNEIKYECNKLKKVKYSVNTLNKLLKIFDKRKLHVCHHNSGIYGKCNTWYKKRVEFFLNYFNHNKVLCSNNMKAITVKQFYRYQKLTNNILKLIN